MKEIKCCFRITIINTFGNSEHLAKTFEVKIQSDNQHHVDIGSKLRYSNDWCHDSSEPS